MPGCLALVQFRRGQRSRGQKPLADKHGRDISAFYVPCTEGEYNCEATVERHFDTTRPTDHAEGDTHNVHPSRIYV